MLMDSWMKMMSFTLHRNTPSLAIIDPRGLSIRSVQMSRTTEERPAEIRVTHQRFDPAGRSVAGHDPRLFEQALLHLDTPANLHRTFSLSGGVLLVESVDSGWCLTFASEAGQALERRDGRDSCRVTEYDDLLRPARILEQGRTVERFGYGAADAFEHNQCNQVIRHDDPAGSSFVTGYGVSGAVLDEARSFLLEPVSPDWPLAESGRDALLESDRLHTCRTVNALGEVLEQTDARGNTQRFSQTVDGQLKGIVLAQSEVTQPLASDLRYNAFNQVEQETAGNGVTSRYVYDPQTGRLNELLATSADGGTLQHLKYVYDPVGNVLEIADPAQRMGPLVRRLVESVRHYRYDTLYQLIEATGFEVKIDTSHGPALPGMQNLPPDPNQIINYTQTYDYDAAGNLLTMHHVGAQTFTRKMRVAPDSNRSLPEGEVDTDFADSFDANGNLQQLVRGQSLSWSIRNQLQQITTVQRETGLNDEERYVYDGQGQRVRKINSAQASGRTLINEVRYLPGLEIRTTADGEILHVITAQAGRNGVRVLHWEAGKPEGIANDQVRYSLNDHLGSSTLELDQQGGLISQESYYPFGGTAWWAGRSAVEAKYKTVRYSGKERDASGLYYYGYRYYAPWLQRWINPDPAGDVDGLNLYRMVKNNPVAYFDASGQKPDPVPKSIHMIWLGENPKALEKQVGNINRTVEMADGYKATLHLETTQLDAYNEIIKDLKVERVNVLSASEFFETLGNPTLYAAYKDFRRNKENYAFSADVLRPGIVHEFGGVYSDVDDVYENSDTDYQNRLGDHDLFADPHEVLTLGPVHVPWEDKAGTDSLLINNSSFAAHRGAGSLKGMMTKGAERYKEALESGAYPDPLNIPGEPGIGLSLLWNAGSVARVKTLSRIVGPKLFTDTLTEADPEHGQLFSNFRAAIFEGKPFTHIELMAKKMPLHLYIKSGAAQTWR